MDQGIQGAEGRLAQAENRHADLLAHRERRRAELTRQRAVSLQGMERITRVAVFAHPDRESPEVRRLQPNLETEAVAMRVAMEFETAQGCMVTDVHEKNLGYDITRLDPNSGELRLTEIKDLGAVTGRILLTPQRAAGRRRPARLLLALRGHRL